MRIREALRGIVDKIVVHLGENTCHVHFKAGIAPVTMKLSKEADVVLEFESENWFKKLRG